MEQAKQIYMNLPDRVGRMARMAAARAGVSLSEYVTDLVTRDAQESGIADLVDGEFTSDDEAPSSEGGK